HTRYLGHRRAVRLRDRAAVRGSSLCRELCTPQARNRHQGINGIPAMCGRFAFYSPAEAAAALFGAEAVPAALALGARYNIAPTEDIPVVRHDTEGEPELVLL